MNSLLIHVKRDEIDVVVLKKKRVVVKYTLRDPDIDVILQQYGPVYASVEIDAIWGDCEFVPIGRLSQIDRYLLKKRLRQKSASLDKITIGPQLFDKATNEGQTERSFLVTTCDISDMSQRVLRQLLEHRIPLNKVDVSQRQTLQAAHVSTKWECLMCRNANYTTLIIGVDRHLVLVRNLMLGALEGRLPTGGERAADASTEQYVPLGAVYSREIAQTFQYLGRTIHIDDEEITILQEEGMEPPSGPELYAANIAKFTGRRSPAKYLCQKQTRPLHTAYLIPKVASCIAVALGIFLLPVSIRNLQLVHEEGKRQQIFAKTSQPMSEEELSLLERRSLGQDSLEKLWQYKSSLRWSEQNGLEALIFALEALHKGRFLRKLRCVSDGSSIVLDIDLSPSDLYRDDIRATEADVLKKHEGEILATTKREFMSKFNKPVQLKTKVSDSGISVAIEVGEKQLKSSVERQAPWYYRFDSNVSEVVPKT
ncbi:MAG: hypothetical protein LBF66_02280 [Holosporales bacterium]|jgi:hypothetical protein|nr:hypothetical protein [Holosporales bacterium]